MASCFFKFFLNEVSLPLAILAKQQVSHKIIPECDGAYAASAGSDIL